MGQAILTVAAFQAACFLLREQAVRHRNQSQFVLKLKKPRPIDQVPPTRVELLQGTLDLLILRTLLTGPTWNRLRITAKFFHNRTSGTRVVRRAVLYESSSGF